MSGGAAESSHASMEREERRECGSWAWVNRSRRIGVRSGPRGAGGWIREESRRGRHASMERDESRERSRSWDGQQEQEDDR